MATISLSTFDFAPALPFSRQRSSYTPLAGEINALPAKNKNDPYRGIKKTADVSYLVLHGLKQKLLALQSLPENWDEQGSAKPNPLAIANALAWLEQIHNQIISKELEWRPPHITASENGEVVFEWWCGNHELTLYFGFNQQAEFIKAWGTHINNEMTDGQLAEPAAFLTLWKWLGVE